MQVIKNLFFIMLDNLDYFVIFLLIFLAVAIILFAVTTLLLGGPGEIQNRLSRLLGKGDDATGDSPRPKFLAREQQGLATPAIDAGRLSLGEGLSHLPGRENRAATAAGRHLHGDPRLL
jgi:hypothetical protein